MVRGRRAGLVAVMLSAVLALAGCWKGTGGSGNTSEADASTGVTTEGQASTDAPDYADKDMWAYYAIGEDKDADLFLICPTVNTSDEHNMALNDERTRRKFLGALNMERGIYEDDTRMFAPYYRQATLKVYDLDADKAETYLETAYEDISSAFDYYLKHENNGRPIVLAGFSQGADMCYRLLEAYFEDKELRDQLVAAYALGWPCTEELVVMYPQIVPATGEDDTGVVVSFDCEAPEVEETFINPKGLKAHAINPLNWRTDGTPADKSENLGACFTTYDGDITREEPGLCGAYVDEGRGAVKVTGIEAANYPPRIPILPDGAYHIYDYQFFFRNLQKNVATRITAHLQKHALDEAA